MLFVTVWEQSFPEYCADSVPCPCHSFRGRVPSDAFVDDHLACALKMLSTLHPAIALLSQGSGTSAYFPGKDRYSSETNDRFRLWHRRHGLPLEVLQMWDSFLEQDWRQHRQYVQHTPVIDWHIVSGVKQQLTGLLVHCEDHFPGHLRTFCPRFYSQSVSRTWKDLSVFTPLDGDEQHWIREGAANVPKTLVRRYSWGIDKHAALPEGYVLLKRKKAFATGRSIIGYHSFVLKKLLIIGFLDPPPDPTPNQNPSGPLWSLSIPGSQRAAADRDHNPNP